ncbi:hypothetical protein QTO34_014428 [Cnephaeus nilssonii]|uniref:GPN-loop GTPase n=1 Tax=Cnephaeus nilssonii TaxID=3371016 RepID=A0AA40LU02_CNENI|nr:hypothetical protein QTO34_014428 [Eptesicus nilssonii]
MYGIGPNGGIVISFNLFASRFDQAFTTLLSLHALSMMKFIEKDSNMSKYVLIDTPSGMGKDLEDHQDAWNQKTAYINNLGHSMSSFRVVASSRKNWSAFRKDMGSVAFDTGTATDRLSPVSDPSDLTLTRGKLDEEEEEADSDTDDIERKAMQHSDPEFYAIPMARYWKRNNEYFLEVQKSLGVGEVRRQRLRLAAATETKKPPAP